MRKTIVLDKNWTFIKDVNNLEDAKVAVGESVILPHTYNNIDGQDGGNDYFRGMCWYKRSLDDIEIEANKRVYLEFDGAAISSDVYLNKKHLANHKGGYSRFRVDISDYILDNNELFVSVDNSANEEVYPQTADFTFYGGLYRDVKLIIVSNNHFDLDYYGGSGIKVTPTVNGNNADVLVEVYTKGDSEFVEITTNNETKKVKINDNYASVNFLIEDVRLWDGLDDPYLYEVVAKLESDEVSTKYGCRYYEVDAQRGFLLNGREYPLRGVSRHQDRAGVGSALSKEMHIEDMAFIEEIGANTVRLAHYQHAQEFYDLCDEKGIIVWAEIPYITRHMEAGLENTLSQMKELVVQNYNHPSIVVWGLSNEITAASVVNESLLENHRQLNDLCHKLDKTRLTTMANVFMLETDSEILSIPDINSYNLYYGWYLGELEQNDKFFDDFHRDYPNMPIGFSEYGADANPAYQAVNPKAGDYSETYQCVYHEHMLNMINERPWLWATHLWNLFDFAADGRDEGGKNGENQKGLITMDRKLRKDAFYLYKAHWNKKDEFIHLCGKRYVNRAEKNTEIKVYTNLDEVSLYVDNKLVETKVGKHVFTFNIDIKSEHLILVKAKEYTDQMSIKKVETQDTSYIFNVENEVVNWFDKEIDENYYSINDTFRELKKNKQANEIVEMLMAKAMASRGDVAKHVSGNKMLQKMIERMTLSSLIKQAGDAVSSEQINELNRMLQQIKK